MNALGWLFTLAGGAVVLVIVSMIGTKFIRRRLTRASHNRYYQRVREIRRAERERSSES